MALDLTTSTGGIRRLSAGESSGCIRRTSTGDQFFPGYVRRASTRDRRTFVGENDVLLAIRRSSAGDPNRILPGIRRASAEDSNHLVSPRRNPPNIAEELEEPTASTVKLVKFDI